MNSAQDTLTGGLPHSEIPGSPIARISPGLFAACHVLHRLSVPRHPPDALASRLITGVFPQEDALTTAAHRAKTPKGQNPQRAKTLLPASAGGRPPRRRGPTKPRRPRMKTLLRIDTTRYDCARAYPPRSHHNSRFTLQSAPPPQARNRAPGRYVWLLRTRQLPPVAFSAAALRLARRFAGGGGERDRTDDLLLAKQALSQLSYTPCPENSNQ